MNNKLKEHLVNTLALIYLKQETGDEDLDTFTMIYLEPIIKAGMYDLDYITKDIETGVMYNYIRDLYVNKCHNCGIIGNMTGAVWDIVTNKKKILTEHVTKIWSIMSSSLPST